MDKFLCRVSIMLLWKKFMSHANSRVLNFLETIYVNKERAFTRFACSFTMGTVCQAVRLNQRTAKPTWAEQLGE